MYYIGLLTGAIVATIIWSRDCPDEKWERIFFIIFLVLAYIGLIEGSRKIIDWFRKEK